MDVVSSEEKLQALLDQVGESDARPPEPVGGIPRQWVPGWIRWPIRVMMLPWILLDLWAQKVARIIIRPPNRKVGKCLKRGNCCQYILLPEAKGLFGRLVLLLNTQVNGFYLRYQEPYEYEGDRVMVAGCRYLKKDGSCSHYHLRPTVCRTWPMIEYFGHPRILKGCGFKAVPRKASSRLNILK